MAAMLSSLSFLLTLNVFLMSFFSTILYIVLLISINLLFKKKKKKSNKITKRGMHNKIIVTKIRICQGLYPVGLPCDVISRIPNELPILIGHLRFNVDLI